jgi:hypothetical protein
MEIRQTYEESQALLASAAVNTQRETPGGNTVVEAARKGDREVGDADMDAVFARIAELEAMEEAAAAGRSVRPSVGEIEDAPDSDEVDSDDEEEDGSARGVRGNTTAMAAEASSALDAGAVAVADITSAFAPVRLSAAPAVSASILNGVSGGAGVTASAAVGGRSAARSGIAAPFKRGFLVSGPPAGGGNSGTAVGSSGMGGRQSASTLHIKSNTPGDVNVKPPQLPSHGNTEPALKSSTQPRDAAFTGLVVERGGASLGGREQPEQQQQQQLQSVPEAAVTEVVVERAAASAPAPVQAPAIASAGRVSKFKLQRMAAAADHPPDPQGMY